MHIPPAAHIHIAEQKIPEGIKLRQLFTYIENSFETLTRTPDNLIQAAINDPKIHAENPIVYVPKGIHVARDDIEIRTIPDDGKITSHGLIWLPYPYIVPGGRFDEMYGWDSYFINVGLLESGRWQQAKAMCDNQLFQITHFKKVLNANRTYFLSRSQPPFYSKMVLDLYRYAEKHDFLTLSVAEWQHWLQESLDAIETYYGYFVDSDHLTATGLSRYFDIDSTIPPEVDAGEKDENGIGHYERIQRLLESIDDPGYTLSDYYDKETSTFLPNFWHGDRAMRESGFDPSFLYGVDSVDIIAHNPVCLNSLLYQMESDAIAIAKILGKKESEQCWQKRNSSRLQNMQLLFSEKHGYFLNYNFEKKSHRDYLFATTFYPLWVGAATKEQALAVVKNALPLLEKPGGIQASTTKSGCQWDSPFGWAPFQLICVEGLRRYGYHDEADRISIAFIQTALSSFSKEGVLLEKYNVEDPENGSTELTYGYTTNEIGFGWTNGTLLALYSMLKAPVEVKKVQTV